MAAKKKRKGVEWVGGLVRLPAFVTDEGEPFQPEALVWLDADGMVVGQAMGRPGDMIGQACQSLRDATTRPMYGRPRVPARVRVASRALADVLESGQKQIDVICAPTPELDEVIATMTEFLRAPDERSYLSSGLEPEAVAAFFEAAAGLYRAAPWDKVPSDECLLSVTIEKLGVKDAVISIIGQMGESFGLLMFPGLEQFEAFVDAADAVARGELPSMPPHFAINFERREDLGENLLEEIAEHQWEVADARAYPWLVAIEEHLQERPLSARDLALAEALALALPPVIADTRALRDAWEGGDQFSRTLVVATHAGDLAVTFRALPTDEFEHLSPATSGIDPDELLSLLASELAASIKSGAKPAASTKERRKKPRKR